MKTQCKTWGNSGNSTELRRLAGKTPAPPKILESCSPAPPKILEKCKRSGRAEFRRNFRRRNSARNSCSDLKQSPKFLLFLLAVLSIIYLQTGTLKQTGMLWESWEFIKRPLLDERNLNGIPWNAWIPCDEREEECYGTAAMQWQFL